MIKFKNNFFHLKFYIFVLVCIFSVLSCKPVASTLKSNGNTGNGPTYQSGVCSPGIECKTTSLDQTNYTLCNHQPAVAPAITSPWKHQRNYTGKTVVTTYQVSITPNLTFTVTNTCSQEGATLVTTATSYIFLATGAIDVRNHSSNTQQTTLPSGKTLTCSTEILTGNFTYSFNGSCLVFLGMGPQASKLTLVPN